MVFLIVFAEVLKNKSSDSFFIASIAWQVSEHFLPSAA
jgi:hypothetical protein